jgi:hypothetical protein
LGAQAARRGFLLILGSALVWVGVAFGGYALYIALLGNLTPPAAAGATAGILLVGPLLAVLAMQFRRTPARVPELDQRPAQRVQDSAMLQLLAGVAKEKPLLAAFAAGLIGAAEIFRRRD